MKICGISVFFSVDKVMRRAFPWRKPRLYRLSFRPDNGISGTSQGLSEKQNYSTITARVTPIRGQTTAVKSQDIADNRISCTLLCSLTALVGHNRIDDICKMAILRQDYFHLRPYLSPAS